MSEVQTQNQPEVRTELDHLREDLSQLKSRFENLASAAGIDVRSRAQLLQEQLGQLKGKFKQGMDSAVLATKSTSKDVQSYVEDNPWKMIAASTVIGFVAGWLINRED